MNVSFLQELLNSIGERGRSLLERSSRQESSDDSIEALCRALLSSRGEASGVAIAGQIIDAYAATSFEKREAFFRFLLADLTPDEAAVCEAAQAFLDTPSPATLAPLAEAVESPRQEFFRRLNLAPGGTACIVAMREDLIDLLPTAPELEPVDTDLLQLLASWFNRGFLVLRRIDWSTPASILEKIIKYEAVHEVGGWADLRRRLDPRDRRCFGFFHPSLIDEPLIFVQVALTREIPGSIQDLLAACPEEATDQGQPTTAVFYSISNCQKGLRGISFGNFLIKQVAEDLSHAIPSLKTFVTLSPVPRFAAWLVRLRTGREEGPLSGRDIERLEVLDTPEWPSHAESRDALQCILLPLAAHYFLRAKTANGRPVDPVARFHLGNGARLERINWLGDRSVKGLRHGCGLMVNYLYDLNDVEKNHEAFANQGRVAASRTVRAMLRGWEKAKGKSFTAYGGRSRAALTADE